jgi:hypothetical protein
MQNAKLKDAGAGLLIEESIFTISRLSVDTDTHDLKATFELQAQSIRTVQANLTTASDQVVMAEAAVEGITLRVHELLTQLWLDARASVGATRAHPLIELLFPKGLGPLKRLSGVALQKEVLRVVATLKDERAQGLGGHARALSDAEKAFEKPLAGLQKAHADREHARARFVEARGRWLDARAVLSGMLTARFPNRVAYVNSFFRASMPRKEKATPAQASAKAA